MTSPVSNAYAFVVTLQPVQTSEHMGALGVFGLCQIVSFVNYLRSKLTPAHFAIFWQTLLYIVGAVFLGAVAFLAFSGARFQLPAFLSLR